jgi:hypothetical protein
VKFIVSSPIRAPWIADRERPVPHRTARELTLTEEQPESRRIGVSPCRAIHRNAVALLNGYAQGPCDERLASVDKSPIPG